MSFSVCSVSRPDKVVFPPPNWSVSQSLREERDIGPELQQVYEVPASHCSLFSFQKMDFVYFATKHEAPKPPPPPSLFQLVNNGPSVVSQSTLVVRCPLRAQGHELLYPVEVVTEGPLSCSSKHTFNALKLKVGGTRVLKTISPLGPFSYRSICLTVGLMNAAPASGSAAGIRQQAPHPEEGGAPRSSG